jgi:hypothetical protein
MGKPEGTRFTIEPILTRLAEGRSVADILAKYARIRLPGYLLGGATETRTRRLRNFAHFCKPITRVP